MAAQLPGQALEAVTGAPALLARLDTARCGAVILAGGDWCLEALDSLGANRGVPVLVVVAPDDEATLVRALALGAASWVTDDDAGWGQLPLVLTEVLGSWQPVPARSRASALVLCVAPPAELVTHLASVAPHLRLDIVDDFAAALDRLSAPRDYELLCSPARTPTEQCLAWQRAAKVRGLRLPPWVVWADSGDEALAAAARAHGVLATVLRRQDYLERLTDCLEHALDHQRLAAELAAREGMQAALSASEQRLSNAATMARLGHWEYDVESDTFTFNDHFYAMFRTTAQQVGGYTMSSAEYARRFLPDEVQALVGLEIAACLASADPHYSRQLEHRVIYGDRREGHLAVRFFGVKDDTGRTVRMYGVNQDVTDRRQAEQALRDSEERYRAIFDGSVATIYVFDHEKRFLDANQAGLELLGYTREELLRLTIPDVDADPVVVQPAHESLLAGRRLVNYEHRLRRRDGSVITVLNNSRPLRDRHGAVVGMLSTLLDISERKRVEAELRQSEERHRTILQTAMDGYWLADLEGHLLEVNETYSRMSGYSVEELLGMRIPALEALETSDEVARTIERLTTEGELRFESRHRRKDGSTFAVEVSVQYRPSDRSIVAFVRDIEQRQLAEQARSALEAQLRQAQKMESVGRLAGGVAHDFNNMLGVIIGYTEMVLGELGPEVPQREALTAVLRAGRRSADLTRQLLAFARKQEIAPRVVDLNDTIAGMLKMLQRLIGEDIRLSWHPKAGLWAVCVDPSQIDQLLANLAVNARDAIIDVGQIRLETDNCRVTEADTRAHADAAPGEYVRLTFTDNGVGMDADTLQHIFEPFFTTKALGRGTGLGLATVYGAVVQNGGFIDVTSAPGAGTTFAIHLPRHRGDPEQAEREAAQRAAVNGHQTILVVEDEQAILRMTKNLLERQGYKVYAADGAAQALLLAEEHADDLDLLLTDVIMPDMNGRELADRVRALQPRIACLYMSGYTADAIAHHGVMEDTVHYLQKPFSSQELVSRVGQVLLEQRLAQR